MIDGNSLELINKPHELGLKVGNRELMITKPWELPEFFRGFFKPLTRQFQEAFPTCKEVLAKRQDIKLFWQSFDLPEQSNPLVLGTDLNEAVTDVTANYAAQKKNRENKPLRAYAPDSMRTGFHPATIGKLLIRVLEKELSTQQAMDLLGEALFLGKTEELEAVYEQLRTDEDPQFESFFTTRETERKMIKKLAPALVAASAGIWNDKRSVIFFASTPVATAALRILLFSGPVNLGDALVSYIFIKFYKHLSYHELAHAMSNVTNTPDGILLGVKRLSEGSKD